MGIVMMRRATFLTLSFLLVACGAQGSGEPTAEEKARHAEVQRLYSEGCKRSGEFIHRRVSDVEGIMLLKLRPTKYSPYDQNAVDPYGYDFDWGYKDKAPPYITTFLIGKDEKGHYREVGPVVEPGYRYVEAVDPEDGKRYRYTGSVKVVGRKDPNTPNHQIDLKRNPNFDLNNYAYVVDRVLATGSTPRYGVTYDDISTVEERRHWIAGSSLKVIDLRANEIIAERIGYMVDFAQGATPGGRQPWTFARWNKGWSCPDIARQSYGARRFVEKVLLNRDAQPIIPPDAAR
ncbi:MAG: hypothetical protein IPN64_11010 [Propionivibrio sp.]|uniref:hypothetical protein n=1 Tax=Propionivibrio sp. TaxID=2212460 RepID=UPI0025DBF309|nr:hypothetical protein [Propionivibrio sp.]MBK8894546.1 hypothetical protein [Propionivibrio sp.]